MKTVKTMGSKRSTYTYTDANGKKYTLNPNTPNPVTGEAIDPKWIALLHRMDDREVENNLKCTRKPVEEWEKPILEDWKKANKGMLPPTRAHISIDLALDDETADKGIIARTSMTSFEAEDAMTEHLHEVVSMLRPDQQELYRRIVVEGENMADVARKMGLDSSAIRHRMETVRNFIKKNFF